MNEPLVQVDQPDATDVARYRENLQGEIDGAGRLRGDGAKRRDRQALGRQEFGPRAASILSRSRPWSCGLAQ